ncbi:glycosyltransferase family 4 protein [Microbacterium sp. B35-04]|uniref:glycosyltransferase family 4 protein n=1 Tax=Microbacterium sp. B35-04 TaxID=1961716 RepID=UPI0013D89940|nr:glycosyltransferase family 4 protein [Microbacterium sp. B35-04]
MTRHANEAQVTVVTLGPIASAEQWLAAGSVGDVITFVGASESGSRAGRRALGLGLDSFIVALKTIGRPRSETYLATNPWIAVALRMLGRQRTVVTGIYATPGTRNWAILRKLLPKALFITLSRVEAENWNRSGGRAVSVIYGNDFPYNPSDPPLHEPFRIFVGGSSDRDLKAVALLEQQVLSSNESIELVVAVGGPERTFRNGPAVVHYLPSLSQVDFGAAIAGSHLTYLPLLDRERAAGHMILVGSMQVGVPVIVTGGLGMDGYIDGRFVQIAPRNNSPLQALVGARNGLPGRSETHEHWRARFSRAVYLSQIDAVIRHASTLSRR